MEQNYGGFKSDTTTQLEEIRSVQNATADSIESARQDSIEANILQHLQAGGHSVIVTGNNHVTDAIGEGVAATLEQSDIPYVAFTEKDNGEETTWDEAQKYSFDAFIEPYLRSHGLEEYIDEYRERFMQVPAPDSTGKH